MKLNLGCGNDIKEGYINIDKRAWTTEVLERDVMRGIPFSDNTFNEIYTSHFLEHIRTGEDIYFIIAEMWRVLENGGLVIARLPHSSSDEAFYPDHISYWNEKMLTALIEDPYQSYGQYKFEIVSMNHIGIELQFTIKAIK